MNTGDDAGVTRSGGTWIGSQNKAGCCLLAGEKTTDLETEPQLLVTTTIAGQAMTSAADASTVTGTTLNKSRRRRRSDQRSLDDIYSRQGRPLRHERQNT